MIVSVDLTFYIAVERYCPRTNEWQTVAAMHESRSFFTLFFCNWPFWPKSKHLTTRCKIMISSGSVVPSLLTKVEYMWAAGLAKTRSKKSFTFIPNRPWCAGNSQLGRVLWPWDGQMDKAGPHEKGEVLMQLSLVVHPNVADVRLRRRSAGRPTCSLWQRVRVVRTLPTVESSSDTWIDNLCAMCWSQNLYSSWQQWPRHAAGVVFCHVTIINTKTMSHFHKHWESGKHLEQKERYKSHCCRVFLWNTSRASLTVRILGNRNRTGTESGLLHFLPQSLALSSNYQ